MSSFAQMNLVRGHHSQNLLVNTNSKLFLRSLVAELFRISISNTVIGILFEKIIYEDNDSPKRAWKAVNKVLNKDTHFIGVSSLSNEGRQLTKEKDIAEALNQHFVTVGQKLTEKLEPKNGDDHLANSTPKLKNLSSS